MLVFFSGRRLKPGRWEQFREAWSPASGEGELPPGAVAIYHARNLKDPDEVISFGIFDVDKDDRSRIRGDEQHRALAGARSRERLANRRELALTLEQRWVLSYGLISSITS